MEKQDIIYIIRILLSIAFLFAWAIFYGKVSGTEQFIELGAIFGWLSIMYLVSIEILLPKNMENKNGK